MRAPRETWRAARKRGKKFSKLRIFPPEPLRAGAHGRAARDLRAVA